MGNEPHFIIFPAEAEAFVESLEDLTYDCYGTEQWYKQHTYLHKLNMQAIASARLVTDEFVKEFVVSHQKVRFLIRDLIRTELWHQNVFKRLMENLPSNTPTFPLYIILYHELVVTNLLETITYHADVVDSLGDESVDLCDWCHRSLCRLVTATSSGLKKARIRALKDKPPSSENSEEELQRQSEILSYEVGMKAVSLIRHLVEHCCSTFTEANSPLPTSSSASAVPLTMARRLLHTHEILCLLCHLLELTPWSCEEDITSACPTKYQWHESGCWIPETDEKNWTLVTKVEGQVWLAIYQILFSGLMGAVRYEILGNSARRQALLSLRPHLTEARIDVIPALGHLRRFLEEFAVAESAALAHSTPTAPSAIAVAQFCHIEDVAQVHDGLMTKFKGKWGKEADKFLARIRSDEGAELARRSASKWAEDFSEENVYALFGPTGDAAQGDAETGFEHPLLRSPRCVICGEIATKRCSRCHNEWYCRRQCQVEHWPRHKKACDIFVASNAD